MYKKKSILIFLLGLVALPLFFSVYTLIEKKLIEHRMKERLEQEKLQIITLEASSVIWLKKGKEILVNGEPFDIRSFTRNEEKIIFTGLFDHQEKKLKKQLEVYYHSKNRSAPAFNSMLLLFFTPYYHTNEPIYLNPVFFVHKQKYLPWPCNNTYKIFKDIISPPPRII